MKKRLKSLRIKKRFNSEAMMTTPTKVVAMTSSENREGVLVLGQSGTATGKGTPMPIPIKKKSQVKSFLDLVKRIGSC